MNNTYARHAAICAKFYELAVDRHAVEDFILQRSGVKPGHRALFVGGMFEIASCLFRHGVDLTVVDYSAEMVSVGRKHLPDVKVEVADLRSLPFENEFDFVFVVGRVFTHMISDEDLRLAVRSCHKALRRSGKLFFDNYEDSKIGLTNYFNGELCVRDETAEIRRRSTTTRLSDSPLVVLWEATYTGILDGKPIEFCDAIEHRAWSRGEIQPFLKQAGFELLAQGDNFDETSFFTLAKAL